MPNNIGLFEAQEILLKTIQKISSKPEGSELAALILIDGYSGTGKSSLAEQATSQLAESDKEDIELITLEDFYPGWTGLAKANELLQELLELRDISESLSYRRWDWTNNRAGESRTLDCKKLWLVEGCGAISANTVEPAILSFWLDAPEYLRLHRLKLREEAYGTARAGNYLWWFNDWQKQHEDFIAKNHSTSLADYFVIAES